MFRILMIVAIFLHPLVVIAASDSFIMRGIIHEKYQLINDKQILVYRVKADEQQESINFFEVSPLTAMIFDEQAAKKRFNYLNGTIILTKTDYVNFSNGYYFNGQFIMTNANGYIGSKKISSSKFILNEDTYVIKSKRALVDDENGKCSILNYYYKLKTTN